MPTMSAKPTMTTKENGTALDRGLQSLSTAESKTVAAEAFLAQQQKINYTKEKASSWHWRLAAILTVVGVVGFVVGNIAIQKYKFPQLFAWHARMRKQKTQGKWPNANYDFYQICTAMQFQPVATMLNLFTVWPMLPRVGAEFLALCVTNLGDMLGPLHWAGTAAQTGAANLLGDKGWASTGCPYDSGETIQTMQSNLINNWSGSRADNIWFPLFPDPRADPDGFLNLCVFKELWKVGGKACPPHGQAVAGMCPGSHVAKSAHIYQLFDGGLCRIAYQATSAYTSGADLFGFFFSGSKPVRADCSAAAAAGAVTGATGAASSMLGVAALAPGYGFIVGATALTVGSAVAGAHFSGAAARETCENKAAEAAAT